MHRNLLFIAVTLACSTQAHGGGATPLAVAEAFCATMVSGTTDPVTLASPGLAGIVETALARNAELQAATPDEKPPLGDGVPWSSWPDKPDTCVAEAGATADGRAEYAVTYGFTSTPDARYADILVLSEGPDGWAIDDVILIDNQRLRAVLETAFDP